jgi:hypothetical protein
MPVAADARGPLAGGYRPLDLSPVCTLSVDDVLAMLDVDAASYPEPHAASPPTGLLSLRGFPFQVGPASGGGPCFYGTGPEGGDVMADVVVGALATDVLVAHAIVGSDLWAGAPVGRVFAEYAFLLSDGSEHVVPIRERFEVGTIPLPWGQYPFLCVPDREDVLEPRFEGYWERAGFRRTEVTKSPPAWWYLWSWTNPAPERALERISFRPRRAGLVIAGVTLGTLAEEPLRPRTHRLVRLTMPEERPVSDPPEVRVDRGLATWPQPLPVAPIDEGLPGRPGWGAEPSGPSVAWHLAVAAVPSATLEVRAGSRPVASLAWDRVERDGRATDGASAIESIDPGRNWVRVTVVDEDTRRPVPCRIAFQTPDGVPFAPHGHHEHLFTGLPDWNGDIGGDVRLGQVTYAYIDGRCEGWLPRGPLIVDVARGFEVEPLRTRVRIEPGQTELRLGLRRWSDLAAEGWHSGDTHVHFLSPQGALAEAAGEDLAVVNLLQAQWGHLFTNTEDFTGGPLASPDGRRVVWVSQENRQHILGHLNLLGLREPVMPWATGGPGEGEVGGGLDTTLARWADDGHARGATVIAAHFPTPNAEVAALVATGRVDAVEMFDQLEYEHAEYYRYLNAGYRLPLVAGTDKMSSGTPVGLYRTWARLADGEAFSFDAWVAAVRAGRTFISSGPILRFTVEGRSIGDVLEVPAGATIEVEGEARSIFPIHSLQLVERGRVVDEVADGAGTRSLQLRSRVRVEGPTWLALRCGGPGYRPIRHFDERRRGVMAHTGPLYVAPGGHYDLRDAGTEEYLLTLIGGGLEYLRRAAPRYPEGQVTHRHGEADHQAWLEAPFHEAIRAIRARRGDA